MFTIGKLSETTGAKVPTIRYYEEIGMFPRPERSNGNQRLYSNTVLDRLKFSDILVTSDFNYSRWI